MANVSSKSRLVASILAVVAAPLGIDLFYKGKIFLGILQIITTFLLVGFFWAFIRMIVTLCGRSTDRHGDRISVWIHK